jgi:hypothetical protein
LTANSSHRRSMLDEASKGRMVRGTTSVTSMSG